MYPINDIRECVKQAQAITNSQLDCHHKDQVLCRIFATLAGDERVGFLAFIIWRSRSRLISSLIKKPI
jgi:hypothetical protein